MTSISMETGLNTSADIVWQTIRDFNGLTKFIPAIVQSSMEGSGVGAVRTLTLKDGAQIIEKLESIEENVSYTLNYSIVSSPLPLKNYLATMQVQDIGNNRCKVAWFSRFEPVGTTEKEAQEIIRGIYSVGFDGLKKLFGDCSS
jgi:hypothetical protein